MKFIFLIAIFLLAGCSGSNLSQDAASSSSLSSSSSFSSSSSSSSSSIKPTTLNVPDVNVIGQVSTLLVDSGTAVGNVIWYLDAAQIGSGNSYRWTVPNSAGSHLILAIFTDSTNTQITLRKTIQIVPNNPPVLTVTAPLNNETIKISSGLDILGMVSSNKPTAFTITATLGSLPIAINSTDTPGGFEGLFDLTGMPPGIYKLTVTARDSLNLITTKQITVTLQ